MNSLKKKAIASLVIICLLLSHSVSVLASVEDIIANNEGTMNVTEENVGGNEELANNSEENPSGNVNTPEVPTTPETPVENNENTASTDENTAVPNQTVGSQNSNETNQNQVAEISENENNEENPVTRGPMTMLRATAPTGPVRATAATGTAEISVSKVLTGATLQANQFSFTITDETGIDLETVKNDAQGNVKFSTITYNQNQVGTHTYTIKEVNEGLQGYTYDTKTITATVEVTDNQDGTLSTNVSYNQDPVFNNSYSLNARTTATIEMTKVLTGARLTNGQFTFELKDTSGATVARATNDAQGRVRFTVGFNNTGTYNYRVTEVNDGAAGYTYDSSTKNVTVGVTNFMGRLLTNVRYSGNRTFTNTYTYAAEGTAQIEVTKQLTGKTLQANQFSFILSDESGAEIETVKNDAQGKVSFSEISYDQTQIGTHTYTITEVNDGASGYTYATTPITATVEVTDNGDRTLNTNITYSPNGVFTNAYTASGTATISASKELTGGTLQANQFSFVLTDETGTEVETVKNDAQGNINFSTITYNQDQVGTHTYTITEVNDGAEGYTYDTKTITATVEVTDNGNGTLSTNVSYSPDPVFSNSYEQQARATATIEVTKILNGATLQEGQFTFELKDNRGTTIARATNDANGRVVFTVGINDAGLHNYRVTEVNDGASGYTYDSSTLNVMVLAVNGLGGRLTATPIYLGGRTFTNTYRAEGTATIEASKVLDGRTLEDGQFTFVLRNRYGMPVQTARNDANGNVSFNLSYNQNDVGTQTYTITERNGRARGYTYDSKTVTVTVEVTDNGDGTLSTNVTYNPEDTVFTNTYRAEGTATIEVSKVLDGRTLENGQFSFTLTDETGTPVETVQNDADGKVSFSTITFNQYEVGTHTYTIREVRGRARGYTYDTKTITATVEVTDNGNGTLSTDVTYSPDGVFNNTYRANGNARIEVSKQLTGRTLTQNQFSFELKDEEGTTLETVRNDLLGRVRFSRINYNQYEVGTHIYTITEVNNGAPGYTYDSKTITATVEVTDNGNGTLSTNVTYSPNSTFNNVYSAEGTAVIELTKQLDGRTLEEGQFNFVARDLLGRTVATATNDAQGRVRFEINYDETDTGIHMYRISEVNDRAPGYTYDRNTITVTVMATDNGRGTINTNVIYGFNRTFNNTYRAEGTAQISVSKELQGLELQPDQFSFMLKDEDGNIIETVTNDANGQVTFSEITYNQYEVGTYKYTISEVDDGVIGFVYDSKVIEVTVEVTDNGDGTLSTNVSYSDEVFINIYERVDVNVKGIWNDKDNEFKYRPESIVVRLYANGVEIDHAIVRESDGWKCVFPGLDKYMDGKRVNYTISEDKFFGYDVTINKNAENDYAIIHDLAPIGGGNPNDFVVTQPVSNVHLMNPRTGANDHVAICVALSIASICTMIVATKRYNNSKNK